MFDEAETVYRTLLTGTNLGAALTATEKQIRFDSPTTILNLLLTIPNAQLNTHAGAGGTMGNTAGDDAYCNNIQAQIDRLNPET